jgi:N utilization substance protein B
MIHPRTRARELALQFLYMHDALQGRDVESLEDYLAAQTPPLDPETARFAAALVQAVLVRRGELDRQISAVALNWKITRMAAVDRNVLRLGLAELIAFPETPYKVIINEAVELARRYSSEASCAFVNGLLDRLRLQQRPAEPPPAPPAAHEAGPAPEGG